GSGGPEGRRYTERDKPSSWIGERLRPEELSKIRARRGAGPSTPRDYFDELAVERVAAVTPATAAPDAAIATIPAVEVKKPAPFFFDSSVVDTTTPVIDAPDATEIASLEPMISPAAFTTSTIKLPAASPGNENWPAASLIVAAASCPVSRSRRRT